MTFFIHKKETTKIITDNGFQDFNIKEFLKDEDVGLHLAEPCSHTENSDI